MGMRHKGFRVRVIVEQVVMVDTGDHSPGNHEKEDTIEHLNRTFPLEGIGDVPAAMDQILEIIRKEGR
jgi:hypothetical protein